jgi:hypothetical protein
MEFATVVGRVSLAPVGTSEVVHPDERTEIGSIVVVTRKVNPHPPSLSEHRLRYTRPRS